jgi:hypothetical protein
LRRISTGKKEIRPGRNMLLSAGNIYVGYLVIKNVRIEKINGKYKNINFTILAHMNMMMA